MLDIGGAELLVIAIVALVVIGPKELPAMLRTIGRAIGMVKKQAQEFRNQFDEAIRDSEFDDLKKSVSELKEEASSGLNELTKGIDKEIREAESIGDDLNREVANSAKGDAKTKADATADKAPHERELEADWLDQYEREAKAQDAAAAQNEASQPSADAQADPGAIAPEHGPAQEAPASTDANTRTASADAVETKEARAAT